MGRDTFTKNRDRLLEGEVAQQFLAAVLAQPKVKRLLSNEHFSVDGTLLEAWASVEELPPEGRLGRTARPGAQRRARLPRRAAPERYARLDHRRRRAAVPQRPGQGGPAVFMGHALMENRNGLVVGAVATRASGHAERSPHWR